jgi:hypothetical protein
MTIADLAELDGLWDELHRGRVYECSLRDPEWHLDGLQCGADVFIDPRSAVLEIVLHELTHRRHPRMGERTVHRAARRLIAQMDEATKAKWWRAYSRVKRKGRPVEVSE